MSQPSLHIQNMSVGYKNLAVAEQIDFRLFPGELCAIVGVNGIGKSTLIRTIAGLQPKLSGAVEILGNATERLPLLESAKRLALVLTDPVATRNLSVKELITLGRQPHTNWWGSLSRSDKHAVDASLSLFSLLELQHKKCFELSDGQLQRVLIARAMTQDTPIILLDEPTTHLDLSHKVEILKLLQQLAHMHQKTILFTTHEIDLAIQLCDKMLIMQGQFNPFGIPHELIAQGHFERLFPKDMVQFDAKTGAFKIKK